MAERILEMKDVRVGFTTLDGRVQAVRGVDLHVDAGETLAIVGESGSGKSQLMMAAMGLLASNGRASGEALYRGRNLLGLPKAELNTIRGRKITMIFQEPMTSLDPLYTVGDQLMEPIIHHRGATAGEARARAVDMLRLVRIAEPERRMSSYPHELSGGQRQRVMIAMALANDPDLLIADEPTTALDVTVQAQVLDLLAEQQRERYMAMILVTHDLGVVAGHTDKIAVMYAGDVVEYAPTRQLFANMKMPYTEALLKSIPRLETPTGSRLPVIEGRLPDPTKDEPGCPFANRCPYVTDKCRAEKPPLTDGGNNHFYRCWFPIGGVK